MTVTNNLGNILPQEISTIDSDTIGEFLIESAADPSAFEVFKPQEKDIKSTQERKSKKVDFKIPPKSADKIVKAKASSETKKKFSKSLAHSVTKDEKINNEKLFNTKNISSIAPIPETQEMLVSDASVKRKPKPITFHDFLLTDKIKITRKHKKPAPNDPLKNLLEKADVNFKNDIIKFNAKLTDKIRAGLNDLLTYVESKSHVNQLEENLTLTFSAYSNLYITKKEKLGSEASWVITRLLGELSELRQEKIIDAKNLLDQMQNLAIKTPVDALLFASELKLVEVSSENVNKTPKQEFLMKLFDKINTPYEQKQFMTLFKTFYQINDDIDKLETIHNIISAYVREKIFDHEGDIAITPPPPLPTESFNKTKPR